MDHRSDIYSLGATLYELATLRPALTGTDRRALLRQVSETDPVGPRRLNPAMPADLETVILKAMSKDPRDRYAKACELADDLERILANKPIQAKLPTL